jgi:hypothetical protein
LFDRKRILWLFAVVVVLLAAAGIFLIVRRTAFGPAVTIPVGPDGSSVVGEPFAAVQQAEGAGVSIRLSARGIRVLAPLAKPIGESTPQDRRDRAAYLHSPPGKARYAQRGTSIEPFFGTIKDFFCLDPLPRQGKRHAATFILLALYAWNLLVLFNLLNDRPLGARLNHSWIACDLCPTLTFY